MNAVKTGTQLYKVFQLRNFKVFLFFWCTLYIELFQLKVLKLAKLKLYWIVLAKNAEKEKNGKIK